MDAQKVEKEIVTSFFLKNKQSSPDKDRSSQIISILRLRPFA